MPKTNVISTKYLNETEALIKVSRYQNNRPALQLVSPSGELLLNATVNIPEVHLTPQYVIIKDYSENSGILDILIEKKIIELTDQAVISGFVNMPICKLLSQSEWQLPIQE